MKMGTPQIIYLVVAVLGLGVHLAKHGEVRPKFEYNFFSDLIWKCIVIGFLYWGGFF